LCFITRPERSKTVLPSTAVHPDLSTSGSRVGVSLCECGGRDAVRPPAALPHPQQGSHQRCHLSQFHLWRMGLLCSLWSRWRRRGIRGKSRQWSSASPFRTPFAGGARSSSRSTRRRREAREEVEEQEKRSRIVRGLREAVDKDMVLSKSLAREDICYKIEWKDIC